MNSPCRTTRASTRAATVPRRSVRSNKGKRSADNEADEAPRPQKRVNHVARNQKLPRNTSYNQSIRQKDDDSSVTVDPEELAEELANQDEEAATAKLAPILLPRLVDRGFSLTDLVQEPSLRLSVRNILSCCAYSSRWCCETTFFQSKAPVCPQFHPSRDLDCHQ